MKRFLIIATAALALTACDNSTEIAQFSSPVEEQGQGTLTNTFATVSILDFSWEPVEAAHQYGYTLVPVGGNAINARMGITRETSLRFEKLEVNTAYLLTVEAYGANGQPTKKFTLEAATNDIVQLAAPDAEKIGIEMAGGVTTITWEPVDNAEYYNYTLTDEGGNVIGEDVTEETTVEFPGLAVGNYQFTLTADTDDENFSTSEPVVIDFAYESQVVETYSATYKTATMGTFNCTLNKMDDGTYVLESFYGVDGYDLVFSIAEADGTVNVVNYYYISAGLKYVATGLTSYDYAAYYDDEGYCTFTKKPGNKKEVKLYVTLGNTDTGDYTEYAYDTLTWK